MDCKKTSQTSSCSSSHSNLCETTLPCKFSTEFDDLTTLHDQVFGARDGRIFCHQYRIGHVRLNIALEALVASGFNESGILIKDGLPYQFADFEELFNTINEIIGSQKGIAGLTVYDIATRIGLHQTPKIAPEKYIYLYRGAKAGAKALLGRNVKYREPFEVFKDLPELKGKPAWQIEDILCIDKNKFNR